MGTVSTTTSRDNNHRSQPTTHGSSSSTSNSGGTHSLGSTNVRTSTNGPDGTNGAPESGAMASNDASTPSFSVQSDILRRLGKLFSSNQTTTHHRGGHGGGDRGLMTEFILGNFRDLGDQYASIFKQSLHQIASMKDGKWYLKK